MKHPYLILVTLCSLAGAAGLAAQSASQELFNGRDLSGWESYLGPRYDVAKKSFSGSPVGLNQDPDGVFSVVMVDGAPAIRISGQVFGTLVTHGEFANYHLRLQFKWGEQRHAPRATSARDSGLLYHSVGPHAAGWFFWMRSQEFQIQEHDVGDYWAVGGASIQVRAKTTGKPEKPDYVHAPDGEVTVFRENTKIGPHVRHASDAERPRGEWNTLDLYCFGQSSLHVVNGTLVMALEGSEQPDGQGGFIPLTKGRIQLQSEGAEVFYRNLTIEPIAALPQMH